VPQHKYIETDARQAWLEERKQAEAEARERWAAHLKAEAAEKAQKLQAAKEAAAAVELAAYEQRTRAAFPGTAKEWAEQWPAIRAAYQRERATQGANAEMERLRATGNYLPL
jgi:uncharacterized protein (DUF924 family)